MTSKKVVKKAASKVLKMGEKKLEAKVGMMANRASKKIDSTVARAQKEFEKARKQAEATMKRAESYIKKNPEKSAAIAAGVGVALASVAALLLKSGGGKKKKR